MQTLPVCQSATACPLLQPRQSVGQSSVLRLAAGDVEQFTANSGSHWPTHSHTASLSLSLSLMAAQWRPSAKNVRQAGRQATFSCGTFQHSEQVNSEWWTCNGKPPSLAGLQRVPSTIQPVDFAIFAADVLKARNTDNECAHGKLSCRDRGFCGVLIIVCYSCTYM